jgi:hypothetical protein
MSSDTMHLDVGSVNQDFVASFNSICEDHVLVLFFSRERYLSFTQEWMRLVTDIQVSSSYEHMLSSQMQLFGLVLKY